MSAGPLPHGQVFHVHARNDAPCWSSQVISESTYPWAQSFAPSSPATSGTPASTGATCESQHPEFAHALKLYECHEATRLCAGSLGSCASQPVRSLEYANPPSMITLFAPAARTALTRVCMPATW